MPERTAKTDAAKSRLQIRVAHAFMHQKDEISPLIRKGNESNSFRKRQSFSKRPAEHEGGALPTAV